MAEKKLLLRISESLWTELNRMAQENFRSLNSEIEFILFNAVGSEKKKENIIREKIADAVLKKPSSLISQTIQDS